VIGDQTGIGTFIQAGAKVRTFLCGISI